MLLDVPFVGEYVLGLLGRRNRIRRGVVKLMLSKGFQFVFEVCLFRLVWRDLRRGGRLHRLKVNLQIERIEGRWFCNPGSENLFHERRREG